MSDGQLLWMLVVLFYVSECCYWVPRTAVVWRFGRRPRVSGDVSGGLGNDHGQLVFWNPLSAAGSGAVFEAWPFSVSGEGVSSGRAMWCWDEVERVWAEGNRVLVDGRVLGRCASEAAAWGHAAFLERVRSAAPAERTALVRGELERSLDRERAVERWRRFSRDARRARGSCGVVGWAMLVWVPVVYWVWGDGIEVLVAAGLLWVAMVVASVLCWRLHGRWFAGSRGARWQNLAISLFAPPHAARGVDGVSRNVMEGIHPLAPGGGGRRFDEALRDVWFPVRGGGDAVERAFREEISGPVLEAAAQARGIDLEAVRGEPAEREDGSEWYCPRCHGGYVEAVGTCADCEGVALRRFGAD